MFYPTSINLILALQRSNNKNRPEYQNRLIIMAVSWLNRTVRTNILVLGTITLLYWNEKQLTKLQGRGTSPRRRHEKHGTATSNRSPYNTGRRSPPQLFFPQNILTLQHLHLSNILPTCRVVEDTASRCASLNTSGSGHCPPPPQDKDNSKLPPRPAGSRRLIMTCANCTEKHAEEAFTIL
jgi:hypothetical protein